MATPVTKRFLQADQDLEKIKRQLTNEFARITEAPFDRLTVIQVKRDVSGIYDYATARLKRMLVIRMEREYFDTVDELLEMGYMANGECPITENWVEAWLDEYNPVTRYRFTTEMDRKRLRFEEAVLTAHEYKDRKILRESAVAAARLLNGQLRQYTTDGILDAHLLAMERAGITKVKWRTMEDEKVCHECESLNNKVFLIDKVPDRHYNCRCWLVPISDS